MYDKMLVIFWVLRDYLLVPPHNGVVQSTNISAVKAAEFNRYLSSFLQESKPPYSTHGWLCVHLILCYYYYYFFFTRLGRVMHLQQSERFHATI